MADPTAAHLLVDGEPVILRQDALTALAEVGVTSWRASVRRAVEGVKEVSVGARATAWPAGWVATILGESWADLAYPAVVVKCGPKAHPNGVPGEVDVLGRSWVGVDLSAGPQAADQKRAVRAAWPLTHLQRRALGGKVDDREWIPPAGWLLVVSVGGWVPPGYVYKPTEIIWEPSARGRRFCFMLEGQVSPREMAAYSGRWIPTRQKELVDLVPDEIDLTVITAKPRPVYVSRAVRIIDQIAALPEGHPGLALADRPEWAQPADLTDAQLDEIESLLAAALRPSPPTPRRAPAPPARTAPMPPAPAQGRRSAAHPQPRVSSPNRWRAPAAVLDGQVLHFDNGDTVELDEEITDYGQAAELVDRYRLGWGDPARQAPDAGQIWLTEQALTAMGLPAETPPSMSKMERSGARQAASEAGWQLGTPSGWQRIWRKDRPQGGSAMIVALPWVAADNPLSVDRPDPAVLARRLRRYAELLGVALRVGPGVTGIDLARQQAPAKAVWTLGHADTGRADRGQVRMAGGDTMPADVLTGPVEVDYVWTRPSGDGEGEWVHCFDRGGSYLAALSSLWCGIGDPIYRAGSDGWTGEEIPGYWRIRRPAWDDPTRPAPTDGCRQDGGENTVWVTTPTMRRLESEGVQLEIVESWSWAERSRVFRPFYERLRDARTALLADTSDDGQAVRRTVKATYARMIGMLDRRELGPGDRNWRPDWRHQILAQSRVGIDLTIRALAAVGRPPVIVATDSLWVRADSPDPEAGWPGDPTKLGRGLGQYAWQGSMRWADLAPIANRAPFNLRQALEALHAAGGADVEAGSQ